jgi:peptidoglycan/LPS O-acetylase OafA/YrhL
VLTVVTVAIAAISYYVIEQPAQRLVRRWLRARRARDTPPSVAVGTTVTAPVTPDIQA